MILGQLKSYLETRGQVSLHEAALHFDMEPEAMRGLLEFWVNKGRIRRRIASECGAGCACEYRQEQEIYLWNPRFGEVSIDID